MKLIVGLGNPGPRYETTRHNAGFLAIDRLVDRWRGIGPNLKHQGEIYKADFGSESVLLVKPQTYMNESGKTVGPLYQFYKLNPEDLIVIHDELDIPQMSLRLKAGGGAGGHNGIKSVDRSVGSAHLNYYRIRMGVGRPEPGNPISPADYVLQQFSDEELADLDGFLDRTADAVEVLIKDGLRSAMNSFNQKGKKS